MRRLTSCIFFFFNDTATTEIYTLSLHDALPIWHRCPPARRRSARAPALARWRLSRPPGSVARSSGDRPDEDRKSTRLNSSHGYISYAVFCLKKKKIQKNNIPHENDVSITILSCR